jgi:hypothetical protein
MDDNFEGHGEMKRSVGARASAPRWRIRNSVADRVSGNLQWRPLLNSRVADARGRYLSKALLRRKGTSVRPARTSLAYADSRRAQLMQVETCTGTLSYSRGNSISRERKQQKPCVGRR